MFADKEQLQLPKWHGASGGSVTSRALPDGPDINYDKLKWTLIGAVNSARISIRIMTPYFIPGQGLLTALQVAALRGVRVEIIVPQKSNIPLFDWAMSANLAKLIPFGIRFYKSPAPFDHSKLFLVDELWSFIGSSNWDTRSLELNFEINLECYDAELNTQLSSIFITRMQASKRISSSVAVNLFARIRNSLARLLSPYL